MRKSIALAVAMTLLFSLGKAEPITLLFSGNPNDCTNAQLVEIEMTIETTAQPDMACLSFSNARICQFIAENVIVRFDGNVMSTGPGYIILRNAFPPPINDWNDTQTFVVSTDNFIAFQFTIDFGSQDYFSGMGEPNSLDFMNEMILNEIDMQIFEVNDDDNFCYDVISNPSVQLVQNDQIPTISQWALFILGMLFTSLGVVVIRNKMAVVS